MLACVTALAGFSASAQGPMGGFGGHGGFGGAVDMSEFAKLATDRLAGALELTGKQYEKIYNIYLNELDRRVNELSNDSNGGFGGFPGMMGPGGPGMGGPGMGGGFPGMGREAGAEGGMMGANLTQAQRTYLRILAQEPTKKDIKAQQTIEKKISKLLTPEKFAKWKEIEKQPLPLLFIHGQDAAGDPIMRGQGAAGDPIMRRSGQRGPGGPAQ